jgi:3-oxoacyl-[acyl-carrier-protein] synthase-3
LSKIVDWSDRSTCVLFGDGAGGVLVSACEGDSCILAEDMHTDGRHALRLFARKLPIKNPWHEDAEESPHVIMDGKAVFDFVTTEIPKSIRASLERAKLCIEDIKAIICHQANERMIETVAKRLKTGLEKFYISISRYGNTSSSSMPIALTEMFEKGLVKKGDKVVISGFGAGLTWGTLVVRL